MNTLGFGEGATVDDDGDNELAEALTKNAEDDATLNDVACILGVAGNAGVAEIVVSFGVIDDVIAISLQQQNAYPLIVPD